MKERLLGRLIPAFLVGAGLLLGSAAPAVAAEDDELTAVARPDGTSRTLLLGGKPTVVRGLQMTVDGGRVVPAFSLAYTATQLSGTVDYTGTTWAEAGANRLAYVQWVIEHGYPSSDRAALIAAAGVQVPAGASRATVDLLLRMGTQAAIWKVRNNVSLSAWRSGAGAGAQNEYAVMRKVYDYLTRVEITAPEPQRTVTFEEGSFVDAPDLFVKGPANRMTVEVENGYAVTDSRYDGGTWLITRVANGGGLTFVRSIDPDEDTTVTVTAEHAVNPGLAFVAEGGRPPLTPALPYGDPVSGTFAKKFPAWGSNPAPQPSPPAGSSPTATPTASPSKTPSTTPSATPTGGTGGGTGGGDDGGLPVTGAPTGTVLGGGLVLLAAGAVAVLLVRRRRLRFTS
ncbi:thioester domain-containing protein [Paractinoplanes maris]|uniref:thioester domain-containing protein n=1 Tax=Paractinoplanes maris TaxID=1734446 RepID=UPI0020201D18|nr:Cys-Gln thioester bond-forming surface protein [Actinoplanes maris]